MYDMKDYKLSEMFQYITGISACDDKESIHRVCWECAARLAAAAAFRKKALLSNALLEDQVHMNKSDITTLKQIYHRTLKSSLTIQTVFTSSDIECRDTIAENNKIELISHETDANKSKTELKLNIEEEGTDLEEEEPLIDIFLKTEVESDPIDENNFNIKTEDEKSEVFSVITHFDDSVTSPLDDCEDEIDNTEEQMTNNDEVLRGVAKIANARKNNDNDMDLVEDALVNNSKLDVIGTTMNESSSQEDIQSLAEVAAANKAMKMMSRTVGANRFNDKENQKIIALKEKGLSVPEIAEETGKSMKRARSLAFEERHDEEEMVRRPRWIREREEHFDTLDDKEFVTRFRLTKPTVLSVLKSIEDKLEFPTDINNSVSPINQLLCALRFYATGCYQMTAADLCGVSTSTTHRIVHRVSTAIASLRPRHIYFPESPDEVRQTQMEFAKTAKFPCVIGAIGCTHLKFTKSPDGENPERFRNRKNYFSLNIQAICNAKLEFTDVVARWPGSTHDSYIFNSCSRRTIFEQGKYGSAVLLGDAGYACNSYMMTPLEQCNSVPENLYNQSHLRTRNCIEILFEVWKRRFPAMAIGLGDSLQNSFPIIIATAVLHNIARRNGEATPPNDNQVLNPDSWNALIAQGIISNRNMDTERSHGTNPDYRRRTELVTNFFARVPTNEVLRGRKENKESFPRDLNPSISIVGSMLDDEPK